jgi:hypothetical protein
VHWDAGGHPNGHMSRTLGLGVPIAIAVVGALVAAGSAWQARSTSAMIPVTVLAAFLAGLFAAISLATVLANHDADRWQDADLPPVLLVLILLGGVVAAVAAMAGLRPSWLRAMDLAGPAGAVQTGGERVAWIGGCHSSWALDGTVALLAVAAVMLAIAGPVVVAAVPAAVAAAIVVFLRSLRVVVGSNGVRVTAGAGWPAVTIPLASIDRAEAVTLDPLWWGGWGYRGSLRLAGRAAWVLRRGQGLRLDLTDGRTFAVTVDRADEAAAVVGEWLARRPPAPSSRT